MESRVHRPGTILAAGTEVFGLRGAASPPHHDGVENRQVTSLGGATVSLELQRGEIGNSLLSKQ